MDSEDSDDNQSIMCAMMNRRPNYLCSKSLMYYNKHLDRYYYYRYFKPYTFDHRLLTMGHDCGCPVRRLHKTSCSWYDTDNIYMIESKADLSISEKSAYTWSTMETLNNLPEECGCECGCGTLASISYMGHSTSCNDFKHIHERESHEVLLAILNKKKKLSFGDETDFNPTSANADVQADADADIADTTQVVLHCAKEATSELDNSSPQALSMLAKNVTSTQNLPNNQANPSSFTDNPLVSEEKHGEKSEAEEMLPLVDITDEITG